MTMLHGVIHGKTIELQEEPGLPDSQSVAVEIRPLSAMEPRPQSAPPWWLARLDVDPRVRPGKFVVKGTCILADELVQSLEAGQSTEELLQAHPDLTPSDLDAVREYARLPFEMRRCFGAWADQTEELDQYLEWTRQL